MAAVRIAWSGTCENCLTCVTIYPHPEQEKDDYDRMADRDEWDAFPACYVCDSTIQWNGTDPVSAVIR